MRRWGIVRADQRGISSVVAVVALLGIFAGATLSVDAGNVWQTRRNMVTATDAAALAEAGELAFNGSSSCVGLYQTILTRNGGDDVYGRTCTVTPFGSPGTGYVVVEGEKPINVRFGAVIGVKDTSAYSMSAAMYGYPSSAIGLRPMAFCDQNAHVKVWRALKAGSISQETYNSLKGTGDVNGDGRVDYPGMGPTGASYATFGVVHRMYFDKSIEDGACGTFPGNWGWLSFNGLPSNTGDRNSWIQNGYSGEVGIRTAGPCAGTPGSGGVAESEAGCPPGDSGELAGNNAAALDSILNKRVYISIFSGGDCAGGGVNCTFQEWAFVGVILRGYKEIGPQTDRYFDFEFTDMQISGSCCGATPINADTGVRAVRLCAADHDTQSVATRCALSS